MSADVWNDSRNLLPALNRSVEAYFSLQADKVFQTYLFRFDGKLVWKMPEGSSYPHINHQVVRVYWRYLKPQAK